MTAPLPFPRVLLKLSGEALMGSQPYGIDVAVVERLSQEILSVHEAGIEVAIVIGGGNIFRGVAGAAQGMDRAVADQVGMLATVMNAIALRSALGAAGRNAVVMSAVPMDAICEPYTRNHALDHIAAGRIVIFAAGTGSPFFTTDTAATLRAAETRCDVVVKGTKVDGVYSADPMVDPDARRYDSLSHDEVLVRGLGVMDTTAIALARDNAIPIIVCSIEEKGSLHDVVHGRGRFTIVTNSGRADSLLAGREDAADPEDRAPAAQTN